MGRLGALSGPILGISFDKSECDMPWNGGYTGGLGLVFFARDDEERFRSHDRPIQKLSWVHMAVKAPFLLVPSPLLLLFSSDSRRSIVSQASRLKMHVEFHKV